MRTDDIGRSLVSGLADALNAHDLARARSYLADDLHYADRFGTVVIGPPIAEGLYTFASPRP